MWVWIIGFVVIVGIMVVVMNRRGSTGASRADDLPSPYGHGAGRGGGYVGGGGGGGDGGDGS